MSYDATISLIPNQKVSQVFIISNKSTIDQYKVLRKMVRNKIITFHIQTQDYGILDKEFITIEDMTTLGIKKEVLEKELAKLEKTTGNPVLLTILKETYKELLSRFPETEPTPPNPGGGKKSRKYKSKNSRKSRKYKYV